MLNKGNVIKTGEITGIFSARIISNTLESILITRLAERFPSPDPEIRTILIKIPLGKRFIAGKLQIFDLPPDSGIETIDEILSERNHQVYQQRN